MRENQIEQIQTEKWLDFILFLSAYALQIWDLPKKAHRPEVREGSKI